MSVCPPCTLRPSCSISIERLGKEYVGSFTVDQGVITVCYEMRARTAKLGSFSSNPDDLARMILAELVVEVQR